MTAAAPGPSDILGRLLTSHPEAASLLAEASHRRALAERSALVTARKFQGMQVARLGYEQLAHRLDPRHHRPMTIPAGLAILAGVAAGLAVISDVELTGVFRASMIVPTAVAVMAAWLTGAWLAVLAERDGRRGLLTAIVIVSSGASLMLAALHVLMTVPRSSPVWPDAGASVLGGVLIIALAAGAAALMARMEPSAVFSRRRAWKRAHTEYQAAVRLEQADTEAATVAGEAWLGLVRSQAATVAGHEGVLRDVVALALTLQEAGQPRLAPVPPGGGPGGQASPAGQSGQE